MFEPLREGEEYILYSGRRDGELPAILVVAAVSEHPALESLERLEHEYSLRDELDSDWAARPLALTHHLGRTVLVLGDPGGAPLDGLLGQPLELARLLRLAGGTPSELPESMLRYVIRTKESVILSDTSAENIFSEDEYLRRKCPRSVLCLPLVKQREFTG